MYFEHTLESLLPLVDAAADLGIERFVLDDGWFTGRTDDRRALGDWTVDPERWPSGLHPLADAVVARGMEFGLWVEPEMVSPDSRLAREHPEWMLADSGIDSGIDSGTDTQPQHPPPGVSSTRLTSLFSEARTHVLESLSALLTEYPITFLKWDHNRDQHAGTAAPTSRAARTTCRFASPPPFLATRASSGTSPPPPPTTLPACASGLPRSYASARC